MKEQILAVLVAGVIGMAQAETLSFTEAVALRSLSGWQGGSSSIALKNAAETGTGLRQGLLRLDLSGISGTVTNASIKIYAKKQVSYTLYLWGVADAAPGQNWNGTTTTLENVAASGMYAPVESQESANDPNLILLGSQVITGTGLSQYDTYPISSPSLMDWLNSDTDDDATVVVSIGENVNTSIRSILDANAPSLNISLEQSSLAHYTTTTNWPSLSNSERLGLMNEWVGLLSVGEADDAPTPRETEIYELLVRTAGAPSAPSITNYATDPDGAGWGGSGEVTANMIRLEQVKDLGYLENAIYHADLILSTRTNIYNEVTGQEEYTWWKLTESDLYGAILPRMSFLDIGYKSSAISSVAKWILQHPVIWDEPAPVDPSIPLSGFGTTYKDRAEFYLQVAVAAYDAFEREGFWWEFDPDNECGTWVQNYSTMKPIFDEYAITNYPNGFDVADYFDIVPYTMGTKPERQFFKAWNRQWHMNWGYLITADALMLLDPTSQENIDFNIRAQEVSEKVLNFWRHTNRVEDDPEPVGTTYIWGYKPRDDLTTKAEDATHLWMDVRAFESHRSRGLFSTEELEIVANSITHRRYDFDNFLPYQNMDKSYFLGEDGAPYDPGRSHPNQDADGPGFGDWMGEYGSDVQVQLFAAKCLEVASERLRQLNDDVTAFAIGGDDVLVTLCSLFEFHEAKVARQRLILPVDPSNTVPVIDPVPSILVTDGSSTNGWVVDLSAIDADAGQTLHYWLVGGNDDYKFKIDRDTGEIRLRDTVDMSVQDSYTLWVEVVDDGAPFRSAITSVAVSITDLPPPVDAPVITVESSALPATITIGETAALSVTATNTVAGGSSSFSWSLLSGPGTVSFSANSSATSFNTVASFDTVGTYELQVVAFNAFGSDSSVCSVTVDAAPLPQASGYVEIDFSTQVFETFVKVDVYTDRTGTVEVVESGAGVRFTGDLWKAFPINYQMTPDTLIEFDFYCPNSGELHAIAMTDTTGRDFVTDHYEIIKLDGTDGGLYITNRDGEYSGGTNRYSIAIGQLLSLNSELKNYLDFVNADNKSETNPDAQSTFSNVIIYEPAGDADDDGLTNAQELALGTDPADSASGFGVDGSPFPISGKIELTWPSAGGVLYRVWQSPDLIDWTIARDWTNALTPPEDRIEFNLSPTNGFFKVEAEIQ